MKTVVPNVSLIIPVYNVEQYLPKCLESIAAQTLKGFEVILVDDGSTDHSLEILRGFARRFPNTCVIHQENGGVSKARNAGIQAARGNISPLWTAMIISPLSICKGCMSRRKNTGRIWSAAAITVTTRSPTSCGPLSSGRPGNLHAQGNDPGFDSGYGDQRLYLEQAVAADSFTEHRITFPTMCFEDISVCQRGFYFSNRIAVIGDPLYFYVQHKDSAIGALNIKKLNDYLRALADLRGFLELQRDFPLTGQFTACTACLWRLLLVI